MSAGIVGTMAIPFHFIPGVLLDTRYTFLAIAGYFGGPAGAVLPLVTAVVRRIAIGGTGVWTALPQIALATAGGLFLNRRWRNTVPSLGSITLLSAWAGLSGVVGFYYFYPVSEWLHVTAETTGPLAVVLCGATLLSGFAISQELRRQKATDENRMYRAVIEALLDCLNAKDQDGRFIIANPATAELMGTDLASIVGKTDAVFYGDDTAERFRRPEKEVLQSGRPLTIEQKFTRLDGTETWLSTLKAPLLDEHGRTVGVITHNREITEHKRLERDLQKTQRLLADAIDSMADGLAMFSADGILIFHNRRFHELFPMTAHKRAPGNCMREIVRASFDTGEETAPATGLDNVVERTADALLRSGDRLIKLADGRTVEARTRVSDSGGSMIVFSDVTEHRNREARLTELNDQLNELARTDALTGLLNRRASDAALRAVASAEPRQAVSLLMADVDFFKAFNDGYGHPEGDECLRKVTGVFRNVFKNVRGAEVARFAGEEFAVILPALEPDQAIALAKIACSAVRAAAIPHDFSEKKVMTVSIGVASASARSAAKLLKSADAALYSAKGAGRDCVRSESSNPQLLVG
jgi:diguanylate cyclase (GGDEF)-like protein/PAS domain S-box-containing protein